MKDDKQQALETRDAISFLFGVEDSKRLHSRLKALHDITWELANATTDQEKIKLAEQIKEWYKLCDF